MNGDVSFRISYSGKRELQGWEVDAIDLRLPLESEVFAEVNSTEKFLSFTIRLFQSTETSKADQISVSSSFAKKMQLTARVFQTYESQYGFKKMPDGTIRKERFVHYSTVSIPIVPLPDSTAGKCYCIQVVNKQGSLQATFEEAIHGEPRIEVRLLNLRPVRLPCIASHGSSTTPLRLFSGQSPKELSEEELRQQLTMAYRELNNAVTTLRKACDQGDEVFFALAKKQAAASRIEQLKAALVREQNLQELSEEALQQQLGEARAELESAARALETACDQENGQILPALTRRQAAALRVKQLQATLEGAQNPHSW